MAALAAAQGAAAIPNLGDTTSPAPKTPGHALIGGPHETVNPANGSVSFDFPIVMPQGRGLTPTFNVSYSSAGSHPFTSFGNEAAAMYAQLSLFSSDGWSYGVPVLTYSTSDRPPLVDPQETCRVSTGYVIAMPDGEREQFNLSITGRVGTPPEYDNPCDGGQNYQEYTTSSHGGWLATTTGLTDDTWHWEPVVVTSPDGTVLQFPADGLATSGTLATSMTDRTGQNTVTYSATSGGALTMTDTLGRVLTTSGFAQASDTIGMSGLAATTVTWASEGASAVANIVGGGTAPCNPATASMRSGTAVTSITTPEGTYTFSYDPAYGMVSRITYPGGGYVRYVWGMATQSEPAQLTMYDGTNYNPCGAKIDNPVITDRYVSPNGSTETEHQTFQYSTQWSGDQWTTKQTIETTTDLQTGASRVVTYTYMPRNLGSPVNTQTWVAPLTPVEQTVATASGGVTLETVTENWTAGEPFLPTDRQTVRNGINVGEVVTGYDGNNQPTSKLEYDGLAGAGGTLKRQTAVTYASFSQNIVDRPATVTVADDGGTQVARTDYGYSADGDLRSQSRWVSGSTWLQSNYTTDAYGNRLTAEDPSGCTTTYNYGGASGDNAYPTSITDCLNHVDTYSWNDATATLASHTDANSQTTSYGYDGWNRLTQVNLPDGGETTYGYTATTLETRRKQDASNWMDTLATFDGIGRLAVEATETTAGSWSRVETCYNGFGEKSRVTYPFTSSSSGGVGSCSSAADAFYYDGLSRPTETQHSDGTTFLTSYTGRATETQDEGNGAGRVTRIAQTDGLGELLGVCEVTAATDAAGNVPTGCSLDISATGFLTSYQHDVLGNLTGVTQGTETRSFAYDGLSRLTSAANPETGTVSYVYGTNAACPSPNSFPGDLVSRTDARGIRTCYRYDALHRLTQKNYSDTTPTVTLTYDTADPLGINGQVNLVGRLSSEYTSSNTGSAFSYDPVGRRTNDWQITPQVWGSSAFEYTYTYNLGGQAVAADYTRGAGLSLAYDLAGRPLSEASSVGGTLISALTYNALGQETGATLGNGIGELRNYDARGRTTEIEAYGGTQIIPGTPGTGSITISGSERSQTIRPCDPDLGCTLWDDGTVWGTIAGVRHSASYGQGDDMYSVASSLASSLNGTTVNASASGDVVYITAARNGSDTNYSLSAGSQSNEGMSSFSAAGSGASLTGGTNDQIVHNQIVYHLNGVSYAPDGDLLGAADSINGTWGYSFNALNQMTQANCTATPCNGTALAFSFDRYGNRWASQTGNHTSNAGNQVVGWGYDAAGDTAGDGVHNYTFDAEGRLTAVTGGGTTASYVYDAEGRRVHETVNGVVKEYVYGTEGQELTVVDGSQNLVAGETYFDGRYLGTQAPGGFVWAHTDELGTIRARTNSGGSSVEADTNWPFGAHLNAIGSYSSLHFTGKYRDGESGLDYFGARYYSSALGRFMTPDWSAVPEAVPYANLENPQSLNLYGYQGNNPVTNVDADGHCWPWCTAAIGAVAGAVVGGGAEALAEWLQGKPLDAHKIGHAAAGGAIAGAAIGVAGPEAGAALGLGEAGSATVTTGATVGGSIVGGAAERALNGEKPLKPTGIAYDAAGGIVGSAATGVVAASVSSTIVRELTNDLISIGLGAGERGPSAEPQPGNPKGGVCKEHTPCTKDPSPSPASSGGKS